MRYTTIVIGCALIILSPATARPQAVVDTLLSVGSNATVEVENMVGDITISTWDRNEVRVQATGTAEVHVDREDSEVSVEAELVPGHGRATDFTLTIPKDADIEVHTIEGRISVEGTTGRIDAHSVKGLVRVRGGRNTIDVGSVEGGIELSGARGRVEAHSVNEFVSLTDVVGDIEATTVNGPVTLKRCDARSLEASSVNGAIVFQGPIHSDGWYSMETHNGTIDLTIPQNASATISAFTYNGDFEADFPVTVTEAESGKTTTITLGSGDAQIELETFNGSILLKRSNR
jgi:DUF4097 and DUF4098 domain-containing protein YvlB